MIVLLDKHFSWLHNAIMHLVNKKIIRAEKSTALLGFVSRSLLVIIAFSMLFIVAVGIAIYFYLQYQQTQSQLAKSAQTNEQAALVSAIGKLIMLPSGEQPTVATVSDINKLKGQEFFANARNGDKVLIYTKAQKAILYDPLANKIVEVGPISLPQLKPVSNPTPTPASVKVALYNGTTTVGFTATIAQKLKKSMSNVTIVDRENAQESNYNNTIVVDLTDKQATQAGSLAKILNGQVGQLPQGETKPKDAEILVILGKNAI